MKRIVSLILVALLILSAFAFTGCGINKSEVAILWSGSGEVEVPNSLINSIERAMYTKNINYKHYGANGDIMKQLDQAAEALENGCSVLVVELVADSILEQIGSVGAALQIVNKAKEKDIPVIFFNCVVLESVIASYDKCVSITSDDSTIKDVQAEYIAKYVKDNFKDIDKNKDDKITISGFDMKPVEAEIVIAKVNEILATEDYKVTHSRIPFINKLNTKVELGNVDIFSAEMIITSDDVNAYEVLTKLQEKDYNTDKLKTQFVPIITVGDTVDYKSIVINGRPAIPENLVITENDSDKVIKQKNKEIKKLSELNDYYNSVKNLVDLTAVEESDIKEMIYTTSNVIDSGRISGTVITDNDAIAMAVASVVKNFIKGNDIFKNVASKVKDDEIPSFVVEGYIVKVRYTVYPK